MFEFSVSPFTNVSTYSAGYSIVSYANQVNQLVSIGCPAGKIVGLGLLPTLFELDNSKYTFRMPTVIDITNASEPIDVYQDKVEIESCPTMEEYIIYENSIIDTKGE